MNSFTVDGLDNNDPSVTGRIAPIIAEAVGEFTLLTNQFAAEYGHSTAGQFLTTTKSGTNELHGQGWWYLQNQSLNARDNLSQASGAPRPRYDYNRFGGQAGGPVIKDKLFYFGSYEYQNLTQGATSAGEILVPTADGLSTLNSLASTAGSGVSSTNVGILNDHVPREAEVCNELTNPTCDALGASVTIPMGAFEASSPNFTRSHLFLVSGDYQSARHKVSGRFHWSRLRGPVSGDLPVAQFSSSQGYDTRRVTLSDVFTINPRWITEFRGAYLRADGPSLPVQAISAPGSTDVFGNYSMEDLGLFIGPNSNLPQTGGNNIYQANSNTTYVRGTHTFKFGIDVRDIIAFSQFLPRERGDYIWAGDPNGTGAGDRNLSDLDGFVRDTFPTSVAIRGVGSGHFAQDQVTAQFYFQDTWRIHPRVTLDLGIRYQYAETARDNNKQNLNGLANVGSITGELYTPELLLATGVGGVACVDIATCAADPLNGTPIFDNLSALHQRNLLGHVGNSLIFQKPTEDADNFAPRVGLAWDLFGDGTTSVRAGVGRGFDVLFGNLPLLQLPPQLQAENRETNACILSPSPAWCANVVAGNPRGNGSDIRHNSLGFLAGGGLLPVLPVETSVDMLTARAATGAFVFDEKLPDVWTWSLSVQRELYDVWMVEARYVGTHAIHLPVQRWLSAGINPYFEPGNQLPMFTTASAVPSSFSAGVPTVASIEAQQSVNTPFQLLLAPYGFGGVITMFSPDGRSSYHGGSLSVQRRFQDGLLINGSYTWSKTIDNIENDLFTSLLNPRRPFNMLDIFSQVGLSGLHRKHKLAFSWLYEIPAYGGDNAFARKVLDGWSFGGSFLFEDGQPVTIRAGRDVNGDFDSAADWAYHNTGGTPGVGADSSAVCWDGALVSGFTGAAGGATCVGDTVGYVSDVDNAEWIRPGRFGESNGGRGNFIGADLNTWNFDIGKRTSFWGEGRYIEFRAQFVNVFNQSNYILGGGGALNNNSFASNPTTTNSGYTIPGSGTFLQNDSFSSGGAGNAPWNRVIQFNLKVVF
jgi:hypothetical protein